MPSPTEYQRRPLADARAASAVEHRPFHATAADRIAATEAGLGRKIWAARELPDALSAALWWKRRRWYFADLADGLNGGDDDNPYNIALDERDEAKDAHRKLIEGMSIRILHRFPKSNARLMQAQRETTDRELARMLRLADDCANTTAAVIADTRAMTEARDA